MPPPHYYGAYGSAQNSAFGGYGGNARMYPPQMMHPSGGFGMPAVSRSSLATANVGAIKLSSTTTLDIQSQQCSDQYASTTSAAYSPAPPLPCRWKTPGIGSNSGPSNLRSSSNFGTSNTSSNGGVPRAKESTGASVTSKGTASRSATVASSSMPETKREPLTPRRISVKDPSKVSSEEFR